MNKTKRGNCGSAALAGDGYPAKAAGQHKYEWLTGILERELRAKFSPGSRFYTELAIRERFSLNRQTVRKALAALAEKHLLTGKGRAGNYVADFHEHGYDNRLVVMAMAIRNHIWDQVFLSLTTEALIHERFSLICDFTGVGTRNLFAESLPVEKMRDRLSHALRWRPRTAVMEHRADLLAELGDLRHEFRNLVLLGGPRLPGFSYVASVNADLLSGAVLAARSASLSGYKQLCLFWPHEGHLADDHLGYIKKHGGDAVERMAASILYHGEENWLARMLEMVRKAPTAVISIYDYGALQIKKVLQENGIKMPSQAGVYGMHNTSWSMSEDLTSIAFEPDLWAREVFSAIEELEEAGVARDRLIAPSLVERGSTLPLPAKAHQGKGGKIARRAEY